MNDTAMGSSGQSYVRAKENLRDTVKWLATVLMALAGSILVGTSLTGLSGVSGLNLVLALVGGAVGLGGSLWAVWIMLRLLTTETYFLRQVEADAELMNKLKATAADIIPPQFSEVRSLLNKRREAIDAIRQGWKDEASV